MISEVSPPTNPQYLSHLDTTNGFVLPTYTSAQNVGCPIDTWQISSSGTSVVAPAGLNNPTILNTDRIVAASNQAAHQSYTFFVKVSASLGGANKFFGPYVLHKGCTSSSLVLAMTSTLTPKIKVGAPTTEAYWYSLPFTSLSWCTLISNTVVNNDATGTAWTGTAKLIYTPTGFGATYHKMNIYQTAVSATFTFKMKSVFTNNQELLTNTITLKIYCSNDYTISHDAAPVSPKII